MEDFVGKDELLRILDKDPISVTPDEKDILRARITYLSKEEIKKFGLDVEEVPEEAPEEEGEEEAPEEEPKPKRKTRKKKRKKK